MGQLVISELTTREDLEAAVKGLSDGEIASLVAELDEAAVIQQVIDVLQTTARPRGDLPRTAAVQWEVRGVEEHVFYFEVVDGEFAVHPGRYEGQPRATISLALPAFLRLLAGSLDVVKAYLGRRLRVTGDVLFARNVAQWFDR
jgi:hypothetical protein